MAGNGVAAAQSNRFRYSRDPEDRMAVGAESTSAGCATREPVEPRTLPVVTGEVTREGTGEELIPGDEMILFWLRTSPRSMLRGHSAGKNRAQKYQAVTYIPPPLLFERHGIWCITESIQGLKWRKTEGGGRRRDDSA